jgi:hypothetical protein
VGHGALLAIDVKENKIIVSYPVLAAIVVLNEAAVDDIDVFAYKHYVLDVEGPGEFDDAMNELVWQ